MGFFNIGVSEQGLFGNNGEEIEIYCDDYKWLFIGYINRTANKNRTPRIMGGAKLKKWFNDNAKVDQKILIIVNTPNSIQIVLDKI